MQFFKFCSVLYVEWEVFFWLKKLNIIFQVLADESKKDVCYEMVTDKVAPKECGCVEMSESSVQKQTICSNKCTGDTKEDRCCIFKCLMEGVLVDEKLNYEAFASIFEIGDVVNASESAAQCDSLGEKNPTSCLLHQKIICLQFKKSLLVSSFVKCLRTLLGSSTVFRGNCLPDAKVKQRLPIVT